MEGKKRVIRLREIEDPKARDQIALYAFHSFLLEVQANAFLIHTFQSCEKQPELRAPPAARKNSERVGDDG